MNYKDEIAGIRKRLDELEKTINSSPDERSPVPGDLVVVTHLTPFMEKSSTEVVAIFGGTTPCDSIKLHPKQLEIDVLREGLESLRGYTITVDRRVTEILVKADEVGK